MNTIDIIILILVLLTASALIWKRIQNKRDNKSSGCGGCSGCPSREICSKNNKK